MRKRKVDRPRLLKQAKLNALLRPTATALGIVTAFGAVAAFAFLSPLYGVAVALAGAMLIVGLRASSTLDCPACGTALEVDGERGLFVPPSTVTCTKCRVTGHPKSTLPRRLQSDRPPTASVRRHAKRRAAVQRQSAETADDDK